MALTYFSAPSIHHGIQVQRKQELSTEPLVGIRRKRVNAFAIHRTRNLGFEYAQIRPTIALNWDRKATRALNRLNPVAIARDRKHFLDTSTCPVIRNFVAPEENHIVATSGMRSGSRAEGALRASLPDSRITNHESERAVGDGNSQ